MWQESDTHEQGRTSCHGGMGTLFGARHRQRCLLSIFCCTGLRYLTAAWREIYFVALEKTSMQMPGWISCTLVWTRGMQKPGGE